MEQELYNNISNHFPDFENYTVFCKKMSNSYEIYTWISGKKEGIIHVFSDFFQNKNDGQMCVYTYENDKADEKKDLELWNHLLVRSDPPQIFQNRSSESLNKHTSLSSHHQDSIKMVIKGLKRYNPPKQSTEGGLLRDKSWQQILVGSEEWTDDSSWEEPAAYSLWGGRWPVHQV